MTESHDPDPELRFSYPSGAMYKDYGQAAAGAVIFGIPLVYAHSNIYAVVILGAIVLMFLSFAWSTWRRHRTVIAVTDDGIWTEGASRAALRWTEITRVDLRYFSTKRERGRGGPATDEGTGWMQLRLDGAGGTIKVDSSVHDFRDLATRVMRAIEQHRLTMTESADVNFAAMGLTPNMDGAEEYAANV
jgi:hypothetical protein